MAAVVGVIAALVIVALTVWPDSPSTVTVDDQFVPVAGVAVASEQVTPELEAAVSALMAEPFVRVESVGYITGMRSDLTVALDAQRRAVSWTELLSPIAAVGDPASKTPTRSQYVVIDGDVFVRIVAPGADPNTPFQKISDAVQVDDFVSTGYTDLGRVFDSLDQLAQLHREVPFAAERLPDRTIDGQGVRGFRTMFAATAVVEFLRTNSLEVIGDDEIGGTSTFEIWFSTERLVQLVATGTQFQDGEAIDDVAVRLTYRPDPSGVVVPPSNTVVL